jgi:phenylalanyl-tRNA synthetase beta chain
MPIVNIDLAWLNRLLEQDYPPEVIHESLDQIGCDVEDVVDVLRSRCPSCESLVEHPIGQDEIKACNFCGHEEEKPFATAGSEQVLRLDLLADRPDLFDVGGLARALRGTLEIDSGLPSYDAKPSGVSVTVDKSTQEVGSYRPFIACAVMTLPAIDETSLIAIMKLQENLHWGVGRDRKLASIGVYDLATISGPITYGTLDPDKDAFVPLGMPGKKMTGREILSDHPKGIGYAHLLAELKRYPVLIDSTGQVLSMPPIINSDETRLRQGSTRVFIDVTGISQAAVEKSLDTLVCSLLEIGGTIETVEITDADSTKRITPDLTPGEAEVDLAEARRWLGLPLDEKSLAGALRKMRFDAEPVAGSAGRLKVFYPPYRTDIRHMVDLLEDVAIGYGYANIEPQLVRSMTVGKPRPEELISERARQVLLGLGFTEVMSLPLSTEQQQFERLRLPTPESYPQVSNPKLKDYRVLRTRLMGGLMEALHENRRRPMPLRLFEMDNVADLDPACETGTTEQRRLAFVEIGEAAGYASARSALDALLRELGFVAEYQASDHPTFIPGRAATFTTVDDIQGVLGEVHPEVLTNFGLTYPAALVELTLQRIF